MMKSALLASVVAFLGPAAFAQSLTLPVQCLSLEEGLTVIANQYGENRRATGLAGEGMAMGLYANDNAGTWSLTIALPNGQLCLVASGREYQEVDEPVILVPQGELN